jgi:hypothetical protein
VAADKRPRVKRVSTRPRAVQGPKPVDGAREIARLKRENARLSERLGGLEALLEAQGKVYALLRGLSRESDETK